MVLHGRQSRHVFRRRCTTLALHLLAGLMDLHLMVQSRMHYKQMKTFSQTTASQIFQKWWHYAQFTKLERAQAKVVVAIKQQRLQRLTDVVPNSGQNAFT